MFTMNAMVAARSRQIKVPRPVAYAVQAASNYRALRALGVTVRGTVDVVQATRCIVSGHQLLHSDCDYAGFERHLGLRSVVTSG